MIGTILTWILGIIMVLFLGLVFWVGIGMWIRGEFK